MPDYRAYVVDDEGHIATFEVVSAPDDEAAIEAARPLVAGQDIELWYLDRKVAVLPRNRPNNLNLASPSTLTRRRWEIELSDTESFRELRRKLDQATRLMDATEDPITKDRLAKMVRELERLVEIAADRENEP